MSLSLGRRLGVLALSLAASAALAGPSHAALVAAPGDGIAPDYLEDDTGLRLEECVEPAGTDPAEAVCPIDGDGEHQYYSAEIADLTVGTGTVSWSAGAAGADAAGADAEHFDAGVAIQGDNLAGNTTYTITHPYGTDIATTDDQGDFQIDIPNAPACEPCVAGELLDGPIGPFLRPVGAPAEPGERLGIGDGETGERVTGSPTGNNSVRVSGGGTTVSTDLFVVVAQAAQEASLGIAGVGPAALGFGSRTTGTGASASQSVAIANVGFANLSLAGATLGGANPGDFTIVNAPGSGAGACPLDPLVLGPAGGPGDDCSIAITFTPGGTGPRSATLTIPTDGANGDTSLATGSEHVIALSGTGVAPAPVQQPQQQAAAPAPAAVVAAPVTQQSAAPVVTLPSLNRLGVPAQLSLRSAKARGVTVRLGSANVSRVLVTFRRNGRVVYRKLVATGNQVRLNSRVLRRALRRGTYTVQLTPIGAAGQRGATITRRLTISR